MNNALLIWLILAVSFLLFEIGHPGLFFFLSFSCASLLAALAAYADLVVSQQLLLFVIGWFVAFMVLRRISHAIGQHALRTNMDALQGKTATVISVIAPDASGQVKVNGEIWSARSHNNQPIAVGAVVTILGVRGAHVIVQHN